ncbi:MAG: SAM-dependent methyltransferase [Candidatus Cloacimonetes bacterium]|nr:SAM-dependent methyltransferase [Candidatus Cloacimonadota bacterium]
MSPHKQKQTGSFYTESVVVESMIKWAIREGKESVLEPSFGEGIFIEKSLNRFNELGNDNPKLVAIEIQPEVADSFRNKEKLETSYVINSDFLAFHSDEKFDVVIGNPPYVCLKNISSEQRYTAQKVIEQYLTRCPNNGSLWFPFVLKSISLLKPEGRMAFVLPFEITYTRYAYALWETLSQNFSSLSISRIYEDFFPNVDVETIIFYAAGKNGTTDFIDYNIYNGVEDLQNNNINKKEIICLSEIFNNEKPFISRTLDKTQQKQLINIKNKGFLKPIIDSCKFKIGYVSADKNYFHPQSNIIRHFSIPDENLIPTILNAKEINGGSNIGLEVLKGDCSSKLYCPKNISEGDRLYLENGKMMQVHKKYKCKNRKPWYITPNIEYPDMILTVFGEVPKLIANKGGYAVSNSLLCGSLKGISKEQFICRWYNSLTLLSLELNIHSLGGGTLVIIPGEADRLNIVENIPRSIVSSIYEKLNEETQKNGIEYTYALGDKIVLQDIFGVTDEELKYIHESIKLLRSWRNPINRRKDCLKKNVFNTIENKDFFAQKKKNDILNKHRITHLSQIEVNKY